MSNASPSSEMHGGAPVDEVVIGISFKPIPDSMPMAIAGLRDELKDDYPQLQYQPRLPDPTPYATTISPTVNFSPPQIAAPAPQDAFARIWLVSSDDSRLVQLQSDRLVVNWRKREFPYPGFDETLERFMNTHELLRSTLRDTGTELEATLLEVSYYDWIPSSQFQQGDALNFAKASWLDVDYAEIVPDAQDWNGTFTVNRSEGLTIRLYGQVKGNVMRLVQKTSSIDVGSLATWTCWVQLEPQVSDEQLRKEILFSRRLLKSAFIYLTTEEARRHWGIA